MPFIVSHLHMVTDGECALSQSRGLQNPTTGSLAQGCFFKATPSTKSLLDADGFAAPTVISGILKELLGPDTTESDLIETRPREGSNECE
jgi:hypothetical protein